MIKYLLFVVCFFSWNICRTQTVITGTVVDSLEKPLVNATLTLQDGSSSTLAYGFTNSQGVFRLVYAHKLPPKTAVVASFIGYTKQEKAASLQPMKFVLNASTNQLKNVFVKRNTISQKGDTINYTVKDFVAPTDAVIADVLKRLPGIEVMESGTIKYQGRPINKFYIEGLDLLDARYGLASNNVPANAVEQVQILENHQPIKLLDSISQSNRAALSLKLTKKAKNRLLGRVKLGLGLPATLWDAEWVPMKFGSNKQTLVVYKTNNIGVVNSKEANNLMAEDSKDDFNLETVKSGLLNTTLVTNPNVQAKRYLHNREHFLSVNQLRRLRNQYQLKLNADFIADENARTVTNNSTIFFVDTTVEIREFLQNRNGKTYLRAGAELTKNVEKQYFSNKLNFTYQNLPATAFVGGLFQHNQDLRFGFTSAENNLLVMRTKGRTVYQMIWNTNWASMQQNLAITPGLFATFFNNGVAYNGLNQTLQQQVFSSFASFKISRRIRKFLVEQAFSANAGRYSNIGNLRVSTSASEVRKDSFNVQQTNTELYLKSDSKITWQHKQWTVSGLLPITQFWFNIPFANGSKRLTAVAPTVQTTYKLNSFWNLSADIGYSNNIYPLVNTYSGLVLTNYRSATNHNNIIQNPRSYFVTARIGYRDIIKGIYMNCSFTSEQNTRNWLSQQQFIQLLNVSNYLAFINSLATKRWNVDATKYFATIKTGVTLGLNGNSSRSPQLLGTVLQQSAFRNLQGILKINTLYKQFQLSYQGTYSNLTNRVEKQTEQKTNILQKQVELQFAFGKGFSAKAGYEYTGIWKNKSINTTISLADILLQWRWKNKIDYKLQLDNIFNTTQFTSVQAFTNQVNTNVFTLRPRQCIVSVTFNFQ